MTAAQCARLALDYWTGAGARTLERLDELVYWVVESYHGPRLHWAPAVWALLDDALSQARGRVQAWQLAS